MAGAEELYSNLNKLLADICDFLKDETNYEKLSQQARKQADELIKRSKLQLHEISKFSENQGAYVDMGKPPSSDEDDDDNAYSSIDPPHITPNVGILKQNPYADLPAKDLSQEVKFGALYWKTKIFFNFGVIQRTIYGGIHKNWLLVYSNEKQLKPLQSLDLTYHKARAMEAKHGKNLPQDFEVISTAHDKKTYYFIASTYKDMLQWVTKINQCHEISINQQDGTDADDDGNYDIIMNGTNQPIKDEDEEQNIYNEPLTNQKKKEQIEKPPNLPTRRPLGIKVNTPLPPIPSETRKQFKNISTFSTIKESIDSQTLSFKDDDNEDTEYQQFVQGKNEKVTVNDDNEDAEYQQFVEVTNEKVTANAEILESQSQSRESFPSFSEDDSDDNIYEQFVSTDAKDKIINNDTQLNDIPIKGERKISPVKPPILKEKPKINVKLKILR